MSDSSSSSSLEQNTKKIQERLLEKGEQLTFDEAIDIARTYETTTSQLEQLEREKKDINTIKGNVNKHMYSSDKKPTKVNCNNCGLEHPLRPRDRCPAYGSKCMNCHKDNHWAKVCRSNPQGITTTRSRHRNNANSRSLFLSNSRNRRRSRSSSRNHRDGDESELSDQFETITFESITVGAITPKNPSEDEVFVTIGIDLHNLSNRPATLKAKLDYTAECTRISQTRWLSQTRSCSTVTYSTHSIWWDKDKTAWQMCDNM